MAQKHNRNSGFTLLELLMVIAIIGILAAVIAVNLNGGRRSSRDARRVTDIKALQNSLILYSDSCGGYPIEATERDIQDLGLDENCGGWTATPTGTNIYLLAAPKPQLPAEAGCEDATPPNVNTYLYISDGDTYTIYFCLGSKVGDFASGAHTLTPEGIF